MGEHCAYVLAERIRNKISLIQWDAEGRSISVTTTIGISALSHCVEKKPEYIIEELIKLADMALYHGKSQGRNQSIRYSEISCIVESAG